MSQPLINITRKQAFFFAVFLVLYESLTYVANDLIMPGMLHVVRSFHASENNVASSLTLYVLGGASLQLILGPISDHLGRRPVMLFGGALFFICTALIALAVSMHQFLIMRFFEGMGLCFIGVIGYAVLQEIFAEMDAIRLIAMMTNVAVLAPLLGPVIGALLLQYVNWRYIFLGIAALSLLAWWGLWRFMPESIGQIKITGEEIKRVRFSLKSMYANYAKLFKSLPFVLGSVSFGVVGVMCVSWIGLAPVMLVTEAKLSLVQYGLWQIPIFGSFILANLVLVRLTRLLSLRRLIFLGASISVFGLCCMGFFPYFYGKNYVWLIPGTLIYFFGYGILASPMTRYLLFITRVSKGTASALFSMIFMSVQGIGLEIGNKVYTTHNNIDFGLYSVIIGFIFLCLFLPSMLVTSKHENLNTLNHHEKTSGKKDIVNQI